MANGRRFTWNNKRVGLANIKERLQNFHISYFNSDHRSLLIDLEPKMIFKQIPFRFEAMWSSDTRYNNMIKENWHIPISNNNHNYFENVERLQKETKNWYKSVFGNIYNGIESALANLNFAHNAFDISPTVEDKSYMVNCLCDYLNLLKLEEIF